MALRTACAGYCSSTLRNARVRAWLRMQTLPLPPPPARRRSTSNCCSAASSWKRGDPLAGTLSLRTTPSCARSCATTAWPLQVRVDMGMGLECFGWRAALCYTGREHLITLKPFRSITAGNELFRALLRDASAMLVAAIEHATLPSLLLAS